MWIYLRNCDWNPQKAAEYATKNAESKSVGMYAMYVRKAIVARGIPLFWGIGNACHYKYTLPLLGFDEIEKTEKRRIGDIVIFQPIGGRKFGHIAIWNGERWISDYKQKNMIVHSDYNRIGCKYTFFRKN